MDLRRLRAGEWIAAASGIVLLGSLFLPWYEGVFGGAGAYSGDAKFTAWEAFDLLDVLFALGGLCGIAVLVVTATQRTPALSVAVEALVTLLGLVIAALVLYRVISVPDLEASPGGGGAAEFFFPEGERRLGSWLALLGAAGVVFGSFLAMSDDRRSRPGQTTDSSGRPVPPPAEIQPLPPPGPTG